MNLVTPPSTFWGCVRCVVATLPLLAAAALAAELETAKEIVELPRFVVTDTRELPPPEQWRYGSVPGFEVLSNASDRETHRLIADFQLFREALNIVWPMPDRMNTPLLLIVCGKGDKFDAFVPAQAEESPDTGRASVHLKGKKRSAIVIDLQTSVINLLDVDGGNLGEFGMDASRMTVEHNKVLYREYVHYLLSRSEPRLPAWFEEGMAQIIMAMKVDPTLIEFGKIQRGDEVPIGADQVVSQNAAATAEDPDSAMLLPGVPAEDVDFNIALRRRGLVPFQDLFAVSHDSAAARAPLGNNVWAKQSYAFVHLCMFGAGGKYKAPLAKLLMRSVREPITEPVFKEVFGKTFKQMGLELRGYIQFTDYQVFEYRAKKGEKLTIPHELVLREATPSEIGLVKGKAFELAGHADRAKTEYIAPYIRGERDPQLLAQLGLFERDGGRDDRARKFLTAATAAKTTEPDAYLALARYQFADAVAAAGGKGLFTSDQATAIIKLLHRAMTLPPANPANFELLAETMLRSPDAPTRDQIAPLVAGVRMFPSKLKLVYATAVLCARGGVMDAAHSLVDHGLKVAPDANTRAAFAAVKKDLPPEPAAESAPASSPSGPASPAASTEPAKAKT